jgi:hypothetical protein
VKLVCKFPRDPKVRALTRYGIDGVLARDLYVQMILYCRENMSDGFVPAEEIGVLAYPVPVDHANQLAKQLASVGLTKEASKDEAAGWDVLAYVRRNGTRADVERLSEVRAESGRKGGRPPGRTARSAGQGTGKATGNQIGKQNESRPNPETETETETKEGQNHLAGAERADVDRLCIHLADRIEANGSKRPSVTAKWRDATRLMLDRDKRTETQVHAAIDWCQDNEFWRRNIMSMPTLREQYDRLRLQADEERKAASGGGVKRGHQPYRNPEDDAAYEEPI